jgi:hypothetical protein
VNLSTGEAAPTSGLDPDTRLRLENFVTEYGGVSMTGQPEELVLSVAGELMTGRERAFTEAVTGQEIHDQGLTPQDEIRAWYDGMGI